ncbi:MAG: ABC transporter substrate-binding protein [Verrucomicrobia bacterium]|nr:ABC transporter substrate-binding protein [Verrucomicrobiota bacterium]
MAQARIALLSELVREGSLPPLEERIGPEPVVMEGVEGNGRYGGTWLYYVSGMGSLWGLVPNRLSYTFLVRWSHAGYPIVPHVARGWEVNEDGTEYTFFLRRGMRWSDGHPFTADDIMYWYEHEVKDPVIMGGRIPEILRIQDQVGTIEKVDAFTIRFRFPVPNGLFLERLASFPGMDLTDRPAHYLSRFHPTIGDPELIASVMQSANLQRPRQVYFYVRTFLNPEMPSLRPWIVRTHKRNLPLTMVRNPYYFAVDTEGRQLPYLDRIFFEDKSPDLIAVNAMQGNVVLQTSGVEVGQYSLLMENLERNRMQLRHWMMGERSIFLIQPNQNRRFTPGDREAENKYHLLREPRFRQALSLAIHRENVIRAEYNGLAEPAQAAPPRDSPFFTPELYYAFVEYDPDRANALLDELGLDRRDRQGFRTFADGSRMHFFLNVVGRTGGGAAQTITDYWEQIGIRVTARERSGNLFRVETDARIHDFNVWSGNGEFLPILEPRMFVPSSTHSDWARGYANWFLAGGLFDTEESREHPGAIAPHPDSTYRRTMEVFEHTRATIAFDEKVEIFRENLLLAAENLWTISVSNSPPRIIPLRDFVRNVPERAVYSWDFISPGNTGIETYFFDGQADTPAVINAMLAELRTITPMRTLPRRHSNALRIRHRPAGAHSHLGQLLA